MREPSLRDRILSALAEAGGERWLAEQAALHPDAFMDLVGQTLPLEVTGADGGPVAAVLREPEEVRHAENSQLSAT